MSWNIFQKLFFDWSELTCSKNLPEDNRVRRESQHTTCVSQCHVTNEETSVRVDSSLGHHTVYIASFVSTTLGKLELITAAGLVKNAQSF